ncbi:MAG: S41 family peptidase [Bacteroidales bacterium]|nr:S41 family peptidase [Bacteroidales bacterium]
MILFVCLLPPNGAAFATPLIEEITKIIEEKSLASPSIDFLNKLTIENLNTELLFFDPYAQYVPPVDNKKQKKNRFAGLRFFIHQSQLWVRSDLDGNEDPTGLPEIGNVKAINTIKIDSSNIAETERVIVEAVKKEVMFLTLSTGTDRKEKKYKILAQSNKETSISWSRQGENVVIRINSFVSHETAPRFQAIYRTQINRYNTFIIDLRGCSGGDLYEALEIAGMFVIEKKSLVKSYNREHTETIYLAPRGEKLPYPTLVLIDRYTASAAEVFARILQLNKASLLVGENSYGKCLSQTVFPLSNAGKLWLTTQRLTFPDNSSCNKTGVQPDIFFPGITNREIVEILGTVQNGASLRAEASKTGTVPGPIGGCPRLLRVEATAVAKSLTPMNGISALQLIFL